MSQEGRAKGEEKSGLSRRAVKNGAQVRDKENLTTTHEPPTILEALNTIPTPASPARDMAQSPLYLTDLPYSNTKHKSR